MQCKCNARHEYLLGVKERDAKCDDAFVKAAGKVAAMAADDQATLRAIAEADYQG